MRYINPKTPPPLIKGYLVIESDDSNIGDFTHWYPIVESYKRRMSQWSNTKCVTFGLNTNTQILGRSNKVSEAQLLRMYRDGCEVMAHNRHHVSLSLLTLVSPAAIGDTVLYLSSTANSGIKNNSAFIYTYRLYDDTNEEIVTLTGYNSSANTVTLNEPIAHSYAAGSRFTISDDSRMQLVEGCLSDLVNLGINVKNYTYTYHAGSSYDPNPDAVDYVSGLFDSCRGGYNNTQPLDAINWSVLDSFAIRTSTTKQAIDTQLDATASGNLLMIAFGHGESDIRVVENLCYLIDGALSRGIRIISRKKAVEMFKS